MGEGRACGEGDGEGEREDRDESGGDGGEEDGEGSPNRLVVAGGCNQRHGLGEDWGGRKVEEEAEDEGGPLIGGGSQTTVHRQGNGHAHQCLLSRHPCHPSCCPSRTEWAVHQEEKNRVEGGYRPENEGETVTAAAALVGRVGWAGWMEGGEEEEEEAERGWAESRGEEHQKEGQAEHQKEGQEEEEQSLNSGLSMEVEEEEEERTHLHNVTENHSCL